MAIRYDSVDDGGAFCKVVLEEPDDVITFAREAVADPKKWALLEAPILQRLLVIFQERRDEARMLGEQVGYRRGIDHGRAQGIATENARQRSIVDRSLLVGSKVKVAVIALARAEKATVKDLLLRIMRNPRGCWQVHETKKLERAIRVEIGRHATAQRRLRIALRTGP